MARTIILFGTVLFCLSAWPASPAYAQEHLEHFRAYNAALERNDIQAAAAHAKTAWQAAEEELGESDTTAILAYNFANLVYDVQPAEALAPIKRVIELTGESHELFGAEEPIIILSLVEAYADKKSTKKKENLRALLNQRETEDVTPNLLFGRAWVHLASYDMGRKKFKKGKQSADYALRHYRELHSIAPREAIGAYIVAGVVRVANRKRNNDDLIEAAELFDKAIELSPPQISIETFDPLLAAAAAWSGVTHAAAESDNPGRPRLGSRRNRKPPEIESRKLIKWARPRPNPEMCELNWKKKDIPVFPRMEAARGLLGGVMIGFHTEGKDVVGARILAEVPEQSRFGETTLEAVANWKLEEAPLPGCGSNRLIITRFVLEL